jgi:aminomethyltransferase
MTEGEFLTARVRTRASQYPLRTGELVTDRHSPLNSIHEAAGASFTDFAGWQMPVRYSSDLAEHHAVRTAAGIFDLSHMGEIFIVGPEAADALDYALAGKLSATTIGQAKYSLLLDRQGGIIDDVVVYRTGDDRFMVVANASNREVVAEELLERTSPFDCEVFDESDDLALIAVQGPRSREILIATDGFAFEGGHPDGRDVGDKLTELKYYRALPGFFRTQPVLVARTGYTGEDGFELYVSPDHAEELWNALSEAGTPLGLVPAGLASRDTLRLEAGMPLYGHELGTETFPVQAGLGRVVATATKGDFVGREAVEAGPRPDARRLVGLVAEGKRAARADYEIFASDDSTQAIGVVTSGALSPTLGIPIAMAYVDESFAAPDTVLSVDIRGKRLGYTVTPLPFYRAKKD